MTTKLITAATFLPVTLAEAKSQSRVEASFVTDDALITLLIAVATRRCEQEIGRSLMKQTRETVLDAPFPSALQLRWLPVLVIESIKYLDLAAVETTLVSTEYSSDDLVDIERNAFYVFPAFGKQWPSGVLDAPNAIRARYRAGYSDSATEAVQQAAVPEPIKQWILIQVSTMYEHREEIAAGVAVNALPGRFVPGLLDRYRIVSI
jgi:uncharacterized phiE125 gp8 family phage protein